MTLVTDEPIRAAVARLVVAPAPRFLKPGWPLVVLYLGSRSGGPSGSPS